MALQLSQHLWNAAILALSASVALAAERLSASSQPSIGPRPADGGAHGEIARFITPFGEEAQEALPSPFRIPPPIRVDPFGKHDPSQYESTVASSTGLPSVAGSSAGAAGQRLTAVLVSDDRRVAVIDDAMVRVGDVLGDGSRISAIQPDRVWVVEKNGRWRMLTLTNRGR